MRLTRRKFIYTGLVAAPALTGLYTWQVEPHWLEFVHRPLPIAGLPPELNGATLAQLSDLHVGPKVSDSYLIESFDRLTALKPDFVAVTGDWVSFGGDKTGPHLERILAHLPRGRLGTVGILGNHDYGHLWSHPEDAALVTATATDAGATILRNQAVRLGGLQFIGLDDFWSPAYDPKLVLAQHAADPASIVLCHNPDVADQNIWAGYSGWMLSGHTHGGQCKPPFLPAPFLPVQNKRYTSGEIALENNRRLYINRGLGHLLQVRFNVRPEITIFHLEPAAAPASIPA